MDENINTTPAPIQKSNTVALNLLALAGLIIIAGVGGYLYLRFNNTKTSQAPKSTTTISPTPNIICHRFTDINEALKNTAIACILDLNGTSKGVVSSNIAKLTNLNELDLAGNNLTKFPTAVLNLKKLVTLDLSNNQISTVPQELSKLPKLQILILKDNPISSSSAEQIKKMLPKASILF